MMMIIGVVRQSVSGGAQTDYKYSVLSSAHCVLQMIQVFHFNQSSSIQKFFPQKSYTTGEKC